MPSDKTVSGTTIRDALVAAAETASMEAIASALAVLRGRAVAACPGCPSAWRVQREDLPNE